MFNRVAGRLSRIGSAARRDIGLASDEVPDNQSVAIRGFIDGLTLSNNSVDALKDIDIAAGECRDDGATANMTLASVLVKQIDASWAVGTNAGGLDGTESVAGTPDADTWYHVWLIKRSDTGVVDVLFSESATAPTMPTDYDIKRRIGAVLTDATPDILGFHQSGDRFYWDIRTFDLDITSVVASAATVVVSAPTGLSDIFAILTASLSDSVALHNLVTGKEETDVAASATRHDLSVDAGATVATTELVRRMDTLAEIRYRFSAAVTVAWYRIWAVGWIDPRGRNA